jgi:hypothetical protein
MLVYTYPHSIRLDFLTSPILAGGKTQKSKKKDQGDISSSAMGKIATWRASNSQ